jgi:carbonic anhydrase/acetyltransferase-like protein (isoleucine patch superfamily)
VAIYSLESNAPVLDPSAYVAPTARVIGRVSLARSCSVWPHAVLRGDNEPIEICQGSSIQEGAVLHTDPTYPMRVGSGVTIAPRSMLHGCSIGDGSFVGEGSVILNGAIIGRNCIVEAGSVVTSGKTFPDNSRLRGAPAKEVGRVSESEVVELARRAREHCERARLLM